MSKWSKTPPSEPGWYWWRENAEVMEFERPLLTHIGDEDDVDEPALFRGEWWTTPIEEPPR